MASRYPMSPYPVGWFRMVDGERLAPGEVVRLSYFGRELAAFRDEQGRARVLDAHCAHLGANMAVGGCVVDGELVCPFHKWRYGGDGRCRGTAYPGKVPERALVRAYPTVEVNGMVAAYWHPLEREPAWQLEAIPEFADHERWTPWARKSWRIATHVQEVFENGPDAIHQKTLHCALEFPEWSCETDGYRFHGRMRAPYDAGAGLPDAVAKQESTYTNFGLGFAHFAMTIDYAGLVVERQIHFWVTPVDDTTIEAMVSTRMRRLADDALTQFVDQEAAFHTWRSFEEDIPIWEHKKYRPLPEAGSPDLSAAVLTEADRDVIRVRRWARQFYVDPTADASRAACE